MVCSIQNKSRFVFPPSVNIVIEVNKILILYQIHLIYLSYLIFPQYLVFQYTMLWGNLIGKIVFSATMQIRRHILKQIIINKPTDVKCLRNCTGSRMCVTVTESIRHAGAMYFLTCSNIWAKRAVDLSWMFQSCYFTCLQKFTSSEMYAIELPPLLFATFCTPSFTDQTLGPSSSLFRPCSSW